MFQRPFSDRVPPDTPDLLGEGQGAQDLLNTHDAQSDVMCVTRSLSW